MNWLSWIPLIVQGASAIKGIVDAANTNEGIVDGIGKALPSLAGLLETVGGTLFPKVKPQLRIAAAAMTAFDPNITKWTQGAINSILVDEPGFVPLVVDGLYGAKTSAAVELVQTKLGLTVDGWVGRITQSAIEKALSAK
jgi:peptidoglycan hydrolase-like protein with peptidoglycan-binding domain